MLFGREKEAALALPDWPVVGSRTTTHAKHSRTLHGQGMSSRGATAYNI
jgi:hypothetical protein